jgi:hypothetical protein
LFWLYLFLPQPLNNMKCYDITEKENEINGEQL